MQMSDVTRSVFHLSCDGSQIAKEEKESILGSIPVEFKEKGSVLYASLLDGKAC